MASYPVNPPLLGPPGSYPMAGSRERYRQRGDAPNQILRPSKSVRFKIETAQPRHGPPPVSHANAIPDRNKGGSADLHRNTASSTLVAGQQICRVLRPSQPDVGDMFLLRLLVEILAFSYSVDRQDLEKVLHDSPFPMTLRSDGRRSVLTHWDAQRAYSLGCIAAFALEKISHAGKHAIEHWMVSKLVKGVLGPANALGLPPGYILEKLIEYKAHRCVPGKQNESTLHKLVSARISVFGHELLPAKWVPGRQNINLARQLVTDALVLPGGGMPVVQLIREAICKFQRKHCKSGLSKIPRVVYIDPVVTALTETLRNDALERPKDPLAKLNHVPVPPKPSATDAVRQFKRQSVESLVVEVGRPPRQHVLRTSRSDTLPSMRLNAHSFSLEDLRSSSIRGVAEAPEPHSALGTGNWIAQCRTGR